jgi:hypothetical protein
MFIIQKQSLHFSLIFIIRKIYFQLYSLYLISEEDKEDIFNHTEDKTKFSK